MIAAAAAAATNQPIYHLHVRSVVHKGGRFLVVRDNLNIMKEDFQRGNNIIYRQIDLDMLRSCRLYVSILGRRKLSADE